MTIFVSIASYRDSQLIPTIKSLIENADNKEDLHFGIITQELNNKHPDLSHINNVKHVKVHIKDAKGAGYARKLATELYDGQDFFLQIDSHMRFAKHWDTKIKSMYEWCVKDSKTERVILSQFPAPFEILTDGSEYFPVGDKDFWDEPSWTSVVNTYYGVWAGNRERMQDFSNPHPSHTILGAWLFSNGEIAKEVPYDERISFMGEELCYAIRAYTRGWKIYAPNEMLCWHYYKRPNDPKVWGDKKAKWFDIEKSSKETQRDVLLGNDKSIYGIGDYQKYLEYQKMIGINFHEFYSKKPDSSSDLNFVSEEIVIGDVRSTSGLCLADIHDKCFVDVCSCNCHKEK